MGMGHFVRMSALADAFATHGGECVFFTGGDEPVNFSGFDIIVLDTYNICDEYISALRTPGRILVCVDDNALYNYDCDVLLNYGLHATHLEFSFCGAPPHLLLGPKYALLRSEFLETAPIEVKQQAANVFVCFGGADVRDFTPVAIKALASIPGVNLNVVLGAHTKCDAEVFAMQGENIKVHKNPESVAKIMTACDIAVVSASTICYELAALGIPSIVIPQADNQLENAATLEKMGLMKNLCNKNLRQEAEALLNNYPRRKHEHKRLMETVDPGGALNAARKIMELRA